MDWENHQHRFRVVLVLFLIVTAAFPVFPRTRKMQRLPPGTWGGDHIRITTEGESATIEYDCAHGTIEGPLTLDRNGKFKLHGTHVREQGGPVRQGIEPKSEPVAYTGWTNGQKMLLTVTLRDGGEEIGTFTLVHGQLGRVWKCR